MQLLAELKRRHVIQVGVMYLVVAWVLAQVGDLLFGNIGAPAWVMKAVLALLALGFPLALFMAWAYELKPESAAQPAAAAPAATKTDIAVVVAMPAATAPASDYSIAVLPFVNMSDDKANEFFADGLSEELLNLLTRIPTLRVIARTSSFAFKGKDVDIRTVAEKLNVAHVLEGSVRKSGERVRITAQLIRAGDSSHLWSETYDRTLEDIFAVQDDIAAEVVAALKLKLLGASVPTARETKPEAFTLYLQGRHLANVGSAEAMTQAVDCAQQAIALDPDYAPAWALLADVYGQMAGNGQLGSYADGYARARETAQTALRLDPSLAHAHAVLGRIAASFDRQFAQASAHLNRALELDPNNSEALVEAARLARYRGAFPTGIALARRALGCDPVSPRAHVALARALHYAGQIDEAIAIARKSLVLHPGRVAINAFLAQLMLEQQKPTAAMAALEQEVDAGWRLYAAALVRLALDDQAGTDAVLAELESRHADDMAFQIAALHAKRGATDKAFQWLDHAMGVRDPGIADVRIDTFLGPLRDDPRWQPFLTRIGLSDTDVLALSAAARAS